MHTTRLALLKQVCNHNHNIDTERIDDIVSREFPHSIHLICALRPEASCRDGNIRMVILFAQGSLPDSVGSVGEHGESLPSDMSWEAVDELAPAPTLWVPDHAVTQCMGCNTTFWLGRRKHHCRYAFRAKRVDARFANDRADTRSHQSGAEPRERVGPNNDVRLARRCCGKIFCADCSENFIPLPSEQLYNPVRVCSDCFSRLQPPHSASSCQCNARQQHQGKTENENEVTPPTAINGGGGGGSGGSGGSGSGDTTLQPPLQTCLRMKNLPTTKDTCCDNLLMQATHQKAQPSVAAATAN